MRPIYYLFCLILACQLRGQIHASSEIVSSSGSFNTESMSVTFLMGTPLIGEDSNTDHRLQYGLLYQFELEVILTTATLPSSVELNVFPNPVTRTLNIRAGTAPREDIAIQLFDMQGRVLEESILNEFTGETTMDLTTYQEGIYLLKVNQANATNTYKIIKNK